MRAPRSVPSNPSVSARNSPVIPPNNLQRGQKPINSGRHRPPSTISSQTPSGQPKMGMSPTSRYNSNLKVLRRRDPSIVSIFDQFSHVCVYHYNGKKWEKQGFEGSMFLYERNAYPPYGFYILNRMGMDDYIHRLYPEDDVGSQGGYLMLRSFPDFTARRLAKIQSSAHEPLDKFSNVYAIPGLEKLKSEDKGRSQTVGLWVFTTDAREPMIDVMIRLHSYIKRNVPYPEEFRYGPDRPPPNPHLRTVSTSSDSASSSQAPGNWDNTSAQATLASRSAVGTSANIVRVPGVARAPSTPNQLPGGTELDQLLAKLKDSSPGAHSVSESTPSITAVVSPFTASGSREAGAGSPSNKSPPRTNRTGLALLDSIFASAEANKPISQSNVANAVQSSPFVRGGRPSSRPETPPEPESIIIYSPTPTSSALPQILNQDVIASLLGLPPSRSSSVAPTSTSRSSTSTSREGGDEYEGEREGSGLSSSEGGFSESCTVLDSLPDTDAQMDMPDDEFTGDANDACINGDVTPRVPLNKHQHEITLPTPPHRDHRETLHGPLPPIHSTLTSGPTASSSQLPLHGPEQGNPNVFEANSALWPHPRSPLDDRSTYQDEDIVELDFQDTSALSDPEAFYRALEGRKNQKKKQRMETGKDTGIEGVTDSGQDGGEKKKGRRRVGKKERAILRELGLIPSDEQSSSHSVQLPPPVPSVNRAAAPSEFLAPKLSPTAVNDEVAPEPPEQCTAGEAIKQSIVSAISALPSKPSRMERNEFIRELLTLIHTDQKFVDSLWQEYLSRAV